MVASQLSGERAPAPPARDMPAPPARDIMTDAIAVKRGARGNDLPLEGSSVRFRTAERPTPDMVSFSLPRSTRACQTGSNEPKRIPIICSADLGLAPNENPGFKA